MLVQLFEKVRSISPSVVSNSFETSWTVACQAPLSMKFLRQEYWSGQPFPSAEGFPNPGIESTSPALQLDSSLSEPLRKPSSTLQFTFIIFIVRIFFLIICRSSLHIRDTSFVSDGVINASFYSVVCLDEQMFFILMQSKVSVFSFMLSVFVLRKISLP